MIHCIDVAMDGKCMGFDQLPSSGYDLRYDFFNPLNDLRYDFDCRNMAFKFKIFGGLGNGT